MTTTADQPSAATPSAVELGLESAQKPRSMFARGWEVFAENKLALAALVFLIASIAFAYLGPVFYHGDTTVPNIDLFTNPPGAGAPLGTDQQGFDELAELMKGTQASLEVGLAAGAIAAVVGALYGAVSGYVGGWVDALMMRIVDALMSFPFVFILIFLSAALGKTKTALIMEIGFASWFGITRLVRGEALSIKVRDYVAAAKMMGGGGTRIIYKHILPNTIGTSIVNTTFSIADAIFYLSTLSFLGLGLPATEPDLGALVNNGTNYADAGYWWMIYPAAILIILLIMSFNLIGDALRDAVETRLQKR
ncbi:MAG TPA: ABC transporter permease [Actinocrinis sp.]|nr:ABC transporter permease [Actinocrinis sp.]